MIIEFGVWLGVFHWCAFFTVFVHCYGRILIELAITFHYPVAEMLVIYIVMFAEFWCCRIQRIMSRCQRWRYKASSEKKYDTNINSKCKACCLIFFKHFVRSCLANNVYMVIMLIMFYKVTWTECWTLILLDLLTSACAILLMIQFKHSYIVICDI